MNSTNIFEISNELFESAETYEQTDKSELEKNEQTEETKAARHMYLQKCRTLEEFDYISTIDEGTYGVVYKAIDTRSGHVVAVKELKGTTAEERFIAARRELDLLLNVWDANIVTGNEIVVGSSIEDICIVMEYLPYQLKNIMNKVCKKGKFFSIQQLKCLMVQLLSAVDHLQQNKIMHRDLKPSNILLCESGYLKVADFGMAKKCEFPPRQYSPNVVTLWYRAPELLLLSREYSTPVDIWSVACIFAELSNMQPLFPGTSESDQLKRIFKVLGTPSDAIWPGYSTLPLVGDITFDEYPPSGLRSKIQHELLSDSGLSLLEGFLAYNPESRVTAAEALRSKYFEEQPVAMKPGMFLKSLELKDDEQNSGTDTQDDEQYSDIDTEDDEQYSSTDND